ncbi:beta-1,3-galactosyltransferase 1-like [Pecten maximus]|uniref:beta-1,3-galactosyltransferase 1-like n=1 Tax=Pecten maximus TaxID=6579 RepID=UPI0014586E75|nr:beta-1,3-galactosyltransferase 1-like [Pecten maximus]
MGTSEVVKMRKLKLHFSTVILLLRDPKICLLLFLIGAGIVLHLRTRHESVRIDERAANFRQRLLHQDLSDERENDRGYMETENQGIKEEKREKSLLQSQRQEYARAASNLKLIPDLHHQHRVNIDQHRDQEKTPSETLSKFSPKLYPLDFNLTRILHQYKRKENADLQPINVLNYRYLINPGHTCSGSDLIRVLFIVKSSPHHFSQREIIRDTWADRKRFPWARTIFSFGIPNKNNVTLADLHEESVRHQDIFLVSYLDSYLNLTLKTMSGLKWAVSNCHRAMHVVSVDDDVYVAPDLLLSFLDNLPRWKAETLFSGHRLTGTKPIRVSSSKWYTPKTEYPFKNYPPYIFGGFVIMSMSTVRNFTIAAMYTKLFKFEDVYLGILASKLGIKIRDNIFVNSGRAFTVSSAFKTTIASHYYGNPKDLRKAWDCHLSILDQHEDKAVFCDYIGKRLKQLKSEINSIADWMEFVQKRSST